MIINIKLLYNIMIIINYLIKIEIAMVNSTVSTKMLEKIAKVENFRFEETLTGFKWIGNKAIDLRKEGYTVPFAFEEAIGMN